MEENLMAFVPVTKYLADWNWRSNDCRILVWTDGTGALSIVEPKGYSEFIAVLAMLKTSGVQIDEGGGFLRVPERKPGT